MRTLQGQARMSAISPLMTSDGMSASGARVGRPHRWYEHVSRTTVEQLLTSLKTAPKTQQKVFKQKKYSIERIFDAKYSKVLLDFAFSYVLTLDDVSNAGLRGKCQESDDVCAHDVIDGYFGEGRSLRETKLSNKFAKHYVTC